MLILIFLLLLIGFAVFGDLGAPDMATVTRLPLANWLGASIGALIPLLAVNFPLGLGVFVDPFYYLVQEFLIAGIAGGIVDVPLLLYRTSRVNIPYRRRARDVVILLSITGIMLLLEIGFILTNKAAQLPF